MTDPRAQAREANRRLVRRLLLATAAMFGFGFALVPLYDVFCEITGLNGKVDTRAAAALPAGVRVDTARRLRLELVAQAPSDSLVAIRPLRPTITLHPGELRVARFELRNLTGRPVTVRAVPSVAPGLAASHLRKVQCFCFDEQRLGPRERRQVAVVFYIDPELPAGVRTVSLSYTLFDLRQRAGRGTAAPGRG